MLLPYSADVYIRRWPVSNVLAIAFCCVIFLLFRFELIPIDLLKLLLLKGWNPVGLIGYIFLHAGWLHLIFNMLYLWVFGTALNTNIGNRAFIIVFLTSGIMAGVVHLLLDGTPALGASGAINGIIGFYFVLYPLNRIKCLFLFFIYPLFFKIPGIWLIVSWFVLDALGALQGSATGIAYWAHIGGFLTGISLAVLFHNSGWTNMEKFDDPTLIDYLGGGRSR